MTDTAQTALDFARKCLGWENATCDGKIVLRNALAANNCFIVGSFESAWPYIRDFLGTRYWLQMNLDRSAKSRWYIRIGVQNVARRGSAREMVEIIDDDQTRGLMAACALAVDNLKLGNV